MGLFTAMFGKSATTASEAELASEGQYEYTDSVELTVPDLNLDNCSFEDYKSYKSSISLINSFENPGEETLRLTNSNSSYRELLEDGYKKDVLSRGFLGLW